MRTIGRHPGTLRFAAGQIIPLHAQAITTEQTQAAGTKTLALAYLPIRAIPDHAKLQLYVQGQVKTGTGGTATLRARFGSKATAAVSVTATSYTAVETVVQVPTIGEDTAFFELVGDTTTAYADSATMGLYYELV